MTSCSSVTFTRACEQRELLDAFRCLYRSYLRRGLVDDQYNQPLRLTRHHLLPQTRVFLARSGPHVVGTISLVEDRPLGVPLRCVFHREVESLAGGDLRIAEAGCLAIDPTSAVRGAQVVHHLMGLVAQAAAGRGVSRLVIAVHPRHAPFYERFAGFKRFAGPAAHPSVAGAPAVGLQLNLATLHDDNYPVWRRYFGMKFSPLALSAKPASPVFLEQLARVWQQVHAQEAEAAAPLPVGSYRNRQAAFGLWRRLQPFLGRGDAQRGDEGGFAGRQAS